MENTHFEFIQEYGGIREYRLRSNGLQVLYHEQRAAPIAAFMVTYRVGSRNEGPGLTGATHFLEHMMFKGTGRFHKQLGTSVFHVLQRVGAQVNATTWLDRTNYFAVLPKEHLRLSMEIEADRMRGALLDPSDVESERTVILNELDRGENDPVRNLYHAVWSTAFFAHPYRHPTIGWRSDVESISADGLRHFYDTFYWPDNATATIVGDVDESEALAQVEEFFGAIGGAPKSLPEVTTREPEQRGERRVTIRQAGQLGAVILAYKAPAADDPMTDALDVLSGVLTTGKQSRLSRSLTDRALTTFVYAAESRLRDPGLFTIMANLAPGTTHESVEAIIYEELERVVQDGVTEEEVRRAISQLTAQEAFGRDGPYAIAARLNEAIAAGDWRIYARYLERITTVTKERVQEAAAAILIPDRRTVGYYIPS